MSKPDGPLALHKWCHLCGGSDAKCELYETEPHYVTTPDSASNDKTYSELRAEKMKHMEPAARELLAITPAQLTPDSADTTPLPDGELRRKIYEVSYDVLQATPAKIPRNPTALTDEIMQLIKIHDRQMLEKVLGAIDGVEIDMEATEKHIRSLDISEDEMTSSLVSAQIDYDDRHDTLNDVRKAVEAVYGGEV